jgi:hypothetical protein
MSAVSPSDNYKTLYFGRLNSADRRKRKYLRANCPSRGGPGDIRLINSLGQGLGKLPPLIFKAFQNGCPNFLPSISPPFSSSVEML